MTRGAQSVDAWPEIDGVDSADVREQLRGDARLFLRLLRRLVTDYADLGAAAVEADTLSAHQSLAHKLKGASATLGVTRVFECARDAETAAGAGDLIVFRQRMERAEAELDALGSRIAAAAVLAAPRPQASDRPESPDDGEPVDLAAFAAALRTQSLASLRKFDALDLRLDRLLGVEVAQVLRDHIDHLRFSAAADLVERSSRDSSAP